MRRPDALSIAATPAAVPAHWACLELAVGKTDITGEVTGTAEKAGGGDVAGGEAVDGQLVPPQHPDLRARALAGDKTQAARASSGGCSQELP